jgi:surfactin synthase thioesterase subunit
MKYTDNYVEVEGINIHYLENNSESDLAIFIFPPGIHDGRFIFELGFKPEVEDKYRIFSISYPSRYKSSPLENYNSIEKMSELVYEAIGKLLIEKKIKKIIFIGFSFGSSIITRILQKHNISILEEVIFINPGEFFSTKVKRIFKKIFIPANRSLRYSIFLRFLITKVFRIFHYDYFPTDRLTHINQQWISTLDYRIDPNTKVATNLFLIAGSKDAIISRLSLTKLGKLFKNTQEYMYNGGHILNYGKSKSYKEIKEVIQNRL